MTARQGLIGHQTVVTWLGQDVLTLSPLWPSVRLRAVIVGVNPAPPSVDAGHYYQGRRGTFAFNFLRRAGVLRPKPGVGEYEDDCAVEQGIGFTDLAPRPTTTAGDLRVSERRSQLAQLSRRLEEHNPPLIIAVFQPVVEDLLGVRRSQPGLQQVLFSGAIPVFQLPTSQYGTPTDKDAVAAQLSHLWRDLHGRPGLS